MTKAKAHAATITDDVNFVGDVTGKHDPKSIFDPTEVKGPDPEVWGEDEDRPPSEISLIVTDPVDDEGNPMEVKGPDPKVWGEQ